MAAPRPKILTALTIPTGGWNLHMYVNDGGVFNTLVECTLAAGDYFVSGDNQDDDFLQELMAKAYAALDACGVAAHNAATSAGKPIFWIDDDHLVNVYCSEDFRFKWSEADGDSIADVLGFDTSATVTDVVGPTVAADWQHSYAWYADDDGQTEACNAEDVPEAVGVQSLAPGGQMRTINFATRYTNHLALRALTYDQTLSGGADYTDTAVWPHAPNEPLECWWRLAMTGTRFRVYQQAQQWTSVAEERGTATGGATTTLIDAGKAWDTNPQQFAGKVVRVAAFDSISGVPMSWYITSHDATTLTLPNSVCNEAIGINGGAYAIYDQRYGTYVLDLQKGKMFAPSENPDNGLYSIDIPLRKYVT